MSVTPNIPVKEASIPASSQPAYDAVIRLTDTFCQAHLTHEYQMLCRKLTGVLARKRPSPLTRGKPEVWACAIVRVIGWVNFLDDSSQKPHLKLTAIDRALGVGESTGQGKAKAIRELLKIRPLDPVWSLRSRIKDNPTAWMVKINGFILDARFLKREVQEELYRKGVIPFIPEKRRGLPADDDQDENETEEANGKAETEIPLHRPLAHRRGAS
jgi:hypothetical protein